MSEESRLYREWLRSGDRPPSSAPLLVGESNPYSRKPEHALLPWPTNSAGGRLARLLGLTPAEYLSTFRRLNLLPRGGWSPGSARRAAQTVISLYDGPFVLLGRRVADAFGFRGRKFLEGKFVVHNDWHLALLLPHPSGLCRLWNDPAYARKTRDFVRAMLPGVLPPEPRGLLRRRP